VQAAVVRVWQPQVQEEPVQVTQVQVLDWVDMVISSCLGEPPC
jgi:hypothetical protein